jgi:hypothetical protein
MEGDPRASQYKAWDDNERLFVLRRRAAAEESQLLAVFNRSDAMVTMRLSGDGAEACGQGAGYVIALTDGSPEAEWAVPARMPVWLDTNDPKYGGTRASESGAFEPDHGRAGP